MLLFRGVATEKYIYFESMAEALPFIKKKVKNYTRILQSSKSRKTPGTRHRNQAPWQQSPWTQKNNTTTDPVLNINNKAPAQTVQGTEEHKKLGYKPSQEPF
jgi:hypothetical protein